MTDIAQGPLPEDNERTTMVNPTTSGGQGAKPAAAQVAATAAEQGRQVAAEAGQQARSLMNQARSEVTGQAGVQKKRAVEGLHAFGDELGKLANQSERSGPATHLVRQASTGVGQAARWLDEREPGEIVNEVKAYARRNPGMFLLGAAVLGALAGRLTRGAVQVHQDRNEQDERTVGLPRSGGTPVAPGTMPPPVPYLPETTAYPSGGSAGMPTGQQPPMGGAGTVGGEVRP